MDFISIWFLAFSCAALGFYLSYLLLYRDRSTDEKRYRELARENENVRHSLKLAHDSHTKLGQKFTRQTGQLKTLQALCDDWTDSRQQSFKEHGEMEEALRTKSQRLAEVQAELTSEKQSRIKLEDTQHRLQQEFAANLASAEKTWRKNQAKTDVALGKLESQYGSVATDKSQLAKKLKTAEIQIAKMQAKLDDQQSRLATADKTVTSATERLNAVVDQRDQALTAEATAKNITNGLQQRIDNQEATIHGLRTKYERTMEDLRLELDRRSKAEIELQESMAAASERQTTAVTQLTAQRDKFADQLKAAELEMASLLSNHQQKIDTLVVESDELKSKYSTVCEESETLAKQCDELTLVYSDQENLVSKLTVERDEASAKVAALKAELEDFSTQVADLSGERDELSNQVANLTGEREKFSTQVAGLSGERDELSNQVANLTSEREKFSTQVAGLSGERDELSNQVANLTSEREKFSTQVAGLSGERDELSKQVANLTGEREKFSNQIVGLTGQRNEYSNKIANLTGQHEQYASQITDLTSERDELSNQIASLTSERDGMLTQLEQAKERLGVAMVELKATRATVGELKAETEELQISCQRIGELEALVQSRDANQNDMTEQLALLRSAYEQTQSTNQALEAKIDQLKTQRDGQLSIVSRNDSEIATLQTKLRASEETIRSLRKERAAVLARLANYRTIAEPEAKVISFTEAMEIRSKRDTDYDDEYGGPVRMHATRGLIYTQAPKLHDNLKRISGIAVVLEARLNDYGVYTFKQIMEWKPEAIEEFSHLLTFKDRIERDDWISQARFFYNEKQRVGQTYAA